MSAPAAMNRNLIWLPAMLVTLLLAACGAHGSATPPKQTRVENSVPDKAKAASKAPATCAALVGQPAAKVRNGCIEHGSLYDVSFELDCKDGSTLLILGQHPGYWVRSNKGGLVSGDTLNSAPGSPFGDAQQACYRGQ